MILTEVAVKNLTKEDIIKLIIDYHNNSNQDLKSIKKDLHELRQNFSKLGAELAVTKQVNNVLHNEMFNLNRNLGVMSHTPDVSV